MSFLPNAPHQRPRADDVQDATRAESRGSLHALRHSHAATVRLRIREYSKPKPD
jgi:hypothetical protein